MAARDDQGKPLSERQIRDEIVTIFFAGHETGAAALTWTLYLLASHPEFAGRLTRAIEFDEADNFIDRVLRESMRLYPPAYRISRTVVETCRIGGTSVEAGAEVVIPQWAVHRSPRYYAAADRFMPYRWTPDFTASLPHFAYFPFGGGPRTCIGNTFGMVENKYIISRLLSRYEFATTPNTKAALHLGVTLLPLENSLKLKVTRKIAPLLPKLADRELAGASGCPFHSEVQHVS